MDRSDEHEAVPGQAPATPLQIRMQELRLQSGLTVRQVAERCGLPASTLGGYLRGRHVPVDDERLESVLRALGASEVEVARWRGRVDRSRSRSTGSRD